MTNPTTDKEFMLDNLSIEVPKTIAVFERTGGPVESDWLWAREQAAALGVKGNVLTYNDEQMGSMSRFARMVRLLAILAFLSGGVHLDRLHFMPTHEYGVNGHV